MSIAMPEITKQDCMTIEKVMEEIGVSRQSIYGYINALGIKRIKFPYDRRGYIALSDVERVKEFVSGNRA